MIDDIRKAHERLVKLAEDHRDFLKAQSHVIEFDTKGGMNNILDVPSEIKIKALLVDFRPFLNNDEKFYFTKFTNRLVEEYKDDKDIFEPLKLIRRDWKKLMASDKIRGVTLMHNNKTITFKQLLDTWYQGEYFHPTDEKKKNPHHEYLEKLKNSSLNETSFFYFFSACQVILYFLLWFDDKVLTKILDKYDTNSK